MGGELTRECGGVVDWERPSGVGVGVGRRWEWETVGCRRTVGECVNECAGEGGGFGEEIDGTRDLVLILDDEGGVVCGGEETTQEVFCAPAFFRCT